MSHQTSQGSSSITGRNVNEDDDTASDLESASKRAKAATGPFTCQTCNKSYSRVENLTRHTATHDAVSRFPCLTCGKRFTRSDLLNRHKKIHTSISNPAQIPSSLYEAEDDVALRQKQAYQNAYSSNGSQESWRAQVAIPTPMNRDFTPTQPVSYNDSTTIDSNSLSQPAMALPAWDGFMLYDNSTGFNIGSYDADIAWTFDFAQTDMLYDFSYQTTAGTPSVGDVSEQGNTAQQAVPNPQNASVPLPLSTELVADGVEPVSNDWPDNTSRPESPKPVRRRKLDATIWHAVEVEAQRSSCRFSPYPYSFSGHVDYAIRGHQIVALGLIPANLTTDVELSDAAYPMPTVLEYYLRLYFHHVHDRYPVIHLSTFDINQTAPLLLATMMLAGSSHSKADRGRFCNLFYGPIRTAIMKKVDVDGSYLRTVDNIFTFLLLCLCGTWSGDKQAYEFAEGSRGILVTASRRCRLMDCRPNRLIPTLRQFTMLEAAWRSWIEAERRKRLGLSIYLYDCQYPSFFNNQPYISKAETTNCVFPCSPEYWEAANPESWKMLIGPADIPPSTYYLHALNCCLLPRSLESAPPIAKIDNFGKIVLIYALFTHIFEWRQAVSMLNPTGLMSAFGNSAHDLGDGLRDRRDWLVDSLDSFESRYWTADTALAASILHQLAYVSLNVSLSDLHLAAGRSGSKEDGELAELALKQWANSEAAESTMGHVDKMLQMSHKALENGSAPTGSWELALALFQGGLVTWIYMKLRDKSDGRSYVDQVALASKALRNMGCWRMCSMFGVILKRFENGSQRS